MESMVQKTLPHRTLKADDMLPYKAIKDQWKSGDVNFRSSYDGKWQEYRKTKAMSWPKPIASSISSSEMVPQLQCADSRHGRLAEDTKQNIEPEEKHINKYQFSGFSLSRLREETEEPQPLQNKSVAMQLSKLDEASVYSRVNNKRWSVDEDVRIQLGNRDKSTAEKNVTLRRTKGGLRELIKLHEEEIARASGAPQVVAKRPKHEDLLLSNSCSFDDCYLQPANEIHRSIDASQLKEHLTENLNVERSCATENFFANSDQSEATSQAQGPCQQRRVELVDKCIATDDSTVKLIQELNIELKNEISEKDDMVNLLLKEKEDLLCKLEEQKKVANAYQKLEDRYRRKVFELEKLLLSCSCGGLESKILSDQDLSRPIANR